MARPKFFKSKPAKQYVNWKELYTMLFFLLLIVGFIQYLYTWEVVILVVLTAIMFLIVRGYVRWVNGKLIEQFQLLKAQLNTPTPGVGIRAPVQGLFDFGWITVGLGGKFLNKNIVIYMHEKPGIMISTYYTTITIDVIHYGNSMAISTEGMKTFWDKYWGRKKTDIETGDKAFDQRFEVNGNPKFVTGLLDDEIRKLMKEEVFKEMGTFTLNQSQLTYTEQVVMNTNYKRKRIEKIILVMFMMAKRMEYIR